MKLVYAKDRYIADGSVAIQACSVDGEIIEPYGMVTVCLAGYGLTPDAGHIYMPTYKMTPVFRAQVLKDIADEVVDEIQIGHGRGLYVKLKDDWEKKVMMTEWM